MEFYEDICDVWPGTPIILEDESQDQSRTSVMFSLVFHISSAHLPEEDLIEHIAQDGLFNLNNLTEITVDHHTFEVERNRLIDDTTSRQTLEGILSSMNVPCRPFFVEKILNCAREMATDGVYENYRVLRMHVIMSVIVAHEEEEQQLSADEAETSMVGASKSSLENLEMVEIENQNYPCAICLEEFSVGSHVLRLPCSHVFHRHCIVNWLNKSKSCPLCRFELK